MSPRPSGSNSAHHYSMALAFQEQAIGITNSETKTNALLNGILHALLGLYTPEHLGSYTGATPRGTDSVREALRGL